MNTLYVSQSTKVMIDENENILSNFSDREAIRSIYLLKEPTKIVYTKLVSKLDEDPKYETNTIYGDPGQIVIIFYEHSFKHPVIVVNNELWADNIRSYNDDLVTKAVAKLGEDQSNTICNAFANTMEPCESAD